MCGEGEGIFRSLTLGLKVSVSALANYLPVASYLDPRK